MKALLFIFCSCLVFLACNSRNEKIKQFKISEDFYFETKTLGNRGYTWLYLCKKNSPEHIDLYGARDSTTSSYFMDIDSIKINEIKGDTIIYTIFEVPPGNKFCISDSLILSKRKVLSTKTKRVECQKNGR
jgi:hypothetical protein